MPFQTQEGQLSLESGMPNKSDQKNMGKKLSHRIWAIYNNLFPPVGHPKWWFSKGIPPKMALN